MTETVLDERRLNRALLARQLLLRRAKGSVGRALERIAGLQTQHAPSGYVGLWSRLEIGDLSVLTRALERRTAVQGTLMRLTIHIVSARDYWLFAEGIASTRDEAWKARIRHVGADAVRELARRVRDVLGDGVEHRDALLEVCRAFDPKAAASIWNALPLTLVRVPPSGTWERRRADLYANAESWLGPSTADEQAGLEHLLRRYLGAFGPAPLADAATWAGVPVGRLRGVAERLPLRAFRDERGKTLLDLPRAPLPDPGMPAPVRFLPMWDASLLMHAKRTGVLPDRFRRLVFDPGTPHALPAFLVDGVVAGSWRTERARERAAIVVEPFDGIPRRAVREVRDEAERLLRHVEPDAASHAVRVG